jgi:photosystem II stability/assembly factor-like uncharacterized protein
MNDHTDIETALRASLAAHAKSAPAAGALPERIIAEVDHLSPAQRRRRPRQWQTWTLPLVAAGAVATVAAAMVGVSQFHHDADRKQPAVHVSSVPAPTPTTTATAAPPGPNRTPTPSVTPTTTVPTLAGVHAVDLSFVGPDDGWALATADCLNGSGPGCIAMIYTRDGGSTWTSMKPPPANVSSQTCTELCVRSIRFATPQIGYAFGPAALFMTTDGGASWHREAGGADALETLDGNVIRVTESPPCSPPGCHYAVQTARIGTHAWTTVALPGGQPGMSTGVSLARTGKRAFLDVFGHPAGGASHATSAFFTSADDGASWTNRGEPCPQVGGAITSEVDSSAVASADDGSVTLLCTGRGDESPQFTITSTDGGNTFHPGATTGLGAAPVSALGSASAATLLVSSDSTYRSTDGGRTWRRTTANGAGAPAHATWIGFESTTTGRATDGRTVWTTHDAGQTWSAYAFG